MKSSEEWTSNWPEPTWRRLFVWGLISRIVIVAAGLMLAPHEPGSHWLPHHAEMREELRNGPTGFLEPWYRFDAHFYLNIARYGYGPPNPNPDSAVAFMPLLPIFMAALSKMGVPLIVSGILIPNLAFSIGLAVAGRAALGVLRKFSTVWIGCGLLILYPFSFYFSAPYAESLYLLFTALGFHAWRTNQAVMSAFVWLAGSVSRLTVVSFPVGVVLELFMDRRWPRRAEWVMFACIAIGFGSIMAVSYFIHGNAFAPFEVQRLWGRSSPGLSGLARGFQSFFHDLFYPEVWYTLSKPLVFVIFTSLGIRGFWRHGPVWGCLILFPIFQGISTGKLLSMERFVICCFPAFFELAEVLENNRGLLIAVFVLSLPLQFFFVWLYISNIFVN